MDMRTPTRSGRCMRRPLPWAVLALAACSTIRYTPQEPRVVAAAHSLVDSTCVAVDLALVPSLADVGGAATIVDERLPQHLLIARPEVNQYVVVADHCTHRERALSYEHVRGRFRCSSLGHSEFELDGTVATGMTEAPLMVFRTTLSGSRLMVDLTTCCAPGVPCTCPHGAAAATKERP